VLRFIRQEGLVERAHDLGERILRPRLEDLVARHAGVRNARGAGLLQGIDLDAAVYGPTPGPRLERLVHERGMIARIGRDFMAFSPPLVTPEDTLHQMIDIADAALTALGSAQ
jgi:taurine--2-oxoglutarate transaminase